MADVESNVVHSSGLWENFSKFPTHPIYHLRISVLHNDEGRGDCPSKMFTFPSLDALTTATRHIEGTFGGGMSSYRISKDGVEAGDSEGHRRGDGRTEDLVISFDSQTADESWTEFLGRLTRVEKDWTQAKE